MKEAMKNQVMYKSDWCQKISTNLRKKIGDINNIK